MRILLRGAGRLPERRRALLRRAARLALGPDARREGELCVVLLGDGALRRINREFLGHDYDTDVVSFRYPAQRRLRRPPFGDVYVALGVARRQARELGHGVLRELVTLVAHGTLHLCGYDDRRPEDKRRMFRRQERIARLCLPHEKA